MPHVIRKIKSTKSTGPPIISTWYLGKLCLGQFYCELYVEVNCGIAWLKVFWRRKLNQWLFVLMIRIFGKIDLYTIY